MTTAHRILLSAVVIVSCTAAMYLIAGSPSLSSAGHGAAATVIVALASIGAAVFFAARHEPLRVRASAAAAMQRTDGAALHRHAA